MGFSIHVEGRKDRYCAFLSTCEPSAHHDDDGRERRIGLPPETGA